jgi:predicted dehydrogenase
MNLRTETALIIGCGSIGRRHVANLRSLGLARIAAFDEDRGRLEAAVKDFGVEACRNLEEGFGRQPWVTAVCTPPAFHVQCARPALDAGSHLFVEKPLAASLEGVGDLIALAARQGRVLCVGYNLRFHPGLRRVKEKLDRGEIGRLLCARAEYGQYLPDWRPGRDYRETYTARASLGGGIVLDGSHEIDYLRWLCGEVKAVFCSAGKFSDLEADVEDTAEITFRMEKRLMAQVHLDCVQRGYSRTLKLIGEKGTLTWDAREGLRHYDAGSGSTSEEVFPGDPNGMYREEMAHFLACARGEETPQVDGATGKRVLEIALAALASAAERREIEV